MTSLETTTQVALRAVRDAALICRQVQASLPHRGVLTKNDESPVTVADFASQAIIVGHLLRHESNVSIVAEEESHALKQPENSTLLAAVTSLVKSVHPETTDRQILEWLGANKSEQKASRFWTIDPIDGTKGFISGRQYAIALALVEQGQVQIGVLGCPNMTAPDQSKGTLFLATQTVQAVQIPINDLSCTSPIAVSDISEPASGTVCESVEPSHSDHTTSKKIASALGIEGSTFRIDSQCKYAAVARGDASIYLRLPTRKNYQEKIWDHAAGVAIIQSAGGTVTDVDGQPLDFTCGHLLTKNRGIVATGGSIHAEVLEAVQTAT